jgi:hypothetical protein
MEVLYWGKGRISCFVNSNRSIIVHWGRKSEPTIEIKGAEIQSETKDYILLSELSSSGRVSVSGASFSWMPDGDRTLFVDNTGRKLWANSVEVVEEEYLTEEEKQQGLKKQQLKARSNRGSLVVSFCMLALVAYLLRGCF